MSAQCTSGSIDDRHVDQTLSAFANSEGGDIVVLLPSRSTSYLLASERTHSGSFASTYERAVRQEIACIEGVPVMRTEAFVVALSSHVDLDIAACQRLLQ